MACFVGSTSQRRVLASLGQILRRKAARRFLLSASVVSYIHLNHKYSTTFRANVYEPSTLFSYSLEAGSKMAKTLPSVIQHRTFSFVNVNSQESFRYLQKPRTLSVGRYVHPGTNPGGKGQTAEEMREKNIFTIPNIISFGRILASPFLGYLVLSDNFLAALFLFIVAGFTDMLDGYIARRFPSQMSYLGSVLDPVADKLLVGILTVTLSMVHLIPVPLAFIILGRDVGLILSSFVVRYVSLPQPRTFSRFFDVQLPTVEVTPSTIGKVNTALQLGLIASSLTAPVLDFTSHFCLTALQFLVGLTTVISGVDYMITGRGVNILTNKNRNVES